MPTKIRAFLFFLSLTFCSVFLGSRGFGQQIEETKLEGFVFKTPIQCADGGTSDCSMISLQIYGEAATLIFKGMKSDISKEADVCLGWHYKSDMESGLVCYVSEDASDGLCTFGYDFNTQEIRGWAGSC